MATPNRPRSASTPMQRSSSMSSLPMLRRMGPNNPLTAHFQTVLTNERKIQDFAKSLPRLTEKQLHELGHSDSMCPICLNSFSAILAEEEMALAMDSPTHAIEDLGVTRLTESCGHIFCRKDIRNWMHQGRTTCPTCRRPFIPGVTQPSEPDWAQILPSDLLPIEDLAWMMAGMDGNDIGVPFPPPANASGLRDWGVNTENVTWADAEAGDGSGTEGTSEYAGMYS